MENAFAWLKNVIEWLGQFIPQWEIVDTTRGWIKWVRGYKVKTGGAGIVWHWPVVTRFMTYAIARQTTPLPSQVITTTDEKVVVVSGMLVYEITDLVPLIAHTYDAEDTIRDIATSSLHDVCSHQTWEELRTGQGRTLDTKLRNEAQKDLKAYGVRVIKFTLTTLAPCNVTRVIRSDFQEGEIRS